MYLCVRGVDLGSFYDFGTSIWSFWKGSNSVVFLLFHSMMKMLDRKLLRKSENKTEDKKLTHRQNSSIINWKIVEIQTKSIPLKTHIYMTFDFPGLIQTSKKKWRGQISLKLKRSTSSKWRPLIFCSDDINLGAT